MTETLIGEEDLPAIMQRKLINTSEHDINKNINMINSKDCCNVSERTGHRGTGGGIGT